MRKTLNLNITKNTNICKNIGSFKQSSGLCGTKTVEQRGSSFLTIESVRMNSELQEGNSKCERKSQKL